MERSGHDAFEVLPLYSPENAEENHEKSQAG
jgi:hypothetical protein